MSGIKTILSLAVVAVIAGILFVWFGVFNVAASDKHWAVTNTFLELVRDRSISARADSLVVPNLSDVTRVKRGAANYDAMCAQCHLAPGLDSSELYEGLNPKPPVLYKHEHFAEEPNETFWVIKNGIKMTGMPAWGINNSDEQIWDMIAFISSLGDMTATQYQELVESGEHTHKGGGHSSMDANESSEDAEHGHASNKKTTLEIQSDHDKTPHKH